MEAKRMGVDTNVLQAAVAAVKRRLVRSPAPACALVLGSGWGDAVIAWSSSIMIPYAAIPGLNAPSVEGHAGYILLAEVAGRTLLVFHGRRHWYEGGGWTQVAVPVFVARELGCGHMLLTNAAGAVSPRLAPGSIMIVDDHLNLMGSNPLLGRHDHLLGPRFPDMSAVYDTALRTCLDQAAHAERVRVRHGVYAAVAGPSYETPAEVSALRAMGADAVGMSTVPEAILGRAVGLRVAALSYITNSAASASTHLEHGHVLQRVRQAGPVLRRLLEAFVRRLPV
jgi:inosine/guanosine/xanthosine phosphorylase family protein